MGAGKLSIIFIFLCQFSFFLQSSCNLFVYTYTLIDYFAPYLRYIISLQNTIYVQKIIKLDLDMKHLIDGSLHGKILEFSTKIRTRNVNHGIDTIISPLILQSEASLLLNGLVIFFHGKKRRSLCQ